MERHKIRFTSGDTECAAWHYPGANGGCVVMTGGFVPEASLMANGPVERDPGTGGPAIDQHWRSTDPSYFAAGNLLRGIETAGTAAAEGRSAARAIAASLQGAPAPVRWVAVERQKL